MYIIDKASIINGTSTKAYNVARDDMMNTYCDETAHTFYRVYSKMSLSFILDNFYDIVKEAYYGTHFCKKILKRQIISPHVYIRLNDIIHRVINEAEHNSVKPEQLSLYKDIESIILSQLDKVKNTVKLCCSSNFYEYIELYADILWDIENNGTESDFKEFINSLLDIEEPYVFFSIAPLILSKYPAYSANVIHAKTRMFFKPYTPDMDTKTLCNTLKSITSLKMIIDDEYISSALSICGNINLKYLWYKIASSKIAEIDDKRVKNIPLPGINVNPSSASEAVDLIFSEASNDDINQDRYDYLKYLNLSHRKTILEHVIERHSLFEEYTLTDPQLDYYMDELADTEGNMAVLEWEEDGEPNAVIKEHIMTKKQKEEEDNKGDTKTKDDKEEKDDEVIVTKDNINARKKILDKISKELEKKLKGVTTHYSKDSYDKFVNGKDNDICLGGFGKEKYEEVYKAIKEIVSNEKEFKIFKDNYFTIFLSVLPSSIYYIKESDNTNIIIMPSTYSILYEVSDEDEDDDVGGVEKPKEDLATKIQNKALDHDAERKKKKAIRNEKKTKLKNAGKAIASEPKGWFDSAKRFTKSFDKMDDNRRKRFLIKPGNRHRIFRNFRNALMYGTVAKINIFYTPYLFAINRFSKEKDKRITNELVRELETEIKICDEKISDANSKGDNSEKYKLMRIKAKLEAEMQRVQTNSRYL